MKYVRFQLIMLGGFILTFVGAGIFDVAGGAPLNPLQILWIDFAVDVVLAIGLGFDATRARADAAGAPGRRAPRSSTGRSASGSASRAWRWPALALGVAAWGEHRYDLVVATTMGLTTLSLMHVVAALESREPTETIFRLYTFANRRFVQLIGIALVFTFLVTALAPLQRIFDTVSLTSSQWGICLLGPLVFLAVAELGKLLDRRTAAPAPSRRDRDVDALSCRRGRAVIVPAMKPLQRRLAVARGDEPADVVVRGGRVLSVFTREWLEADVAIVDGMIAGVGSYEGAETVDATGRFVVPGFIDAHMHLESVKLLVDEFARLVLPLGTTAVVADPHEIANVLGSDGVHWLHDASADLQLEVFFMAPSCVPASIFESPRRPLALGRPRGADAATAGARARRDDELPRRDRGRRRRAREARARGRTARRRSRAGRARPVAPGLRRRGHPLRPRGAHGRGGPGAAAGRDVAPHPRGVDGAEPAGAPARSSPSTGRAASPSARTTAIPTTSPTTGT